MVKKLLCAAALSLLGGFVFIYLNYHSQQTALVTSEIDKTFQLATENFKHQLTAKISALSSSPNLGKNIDWGLENSIKQTLTGFLENHFVEHLQIINSDCKMIAKSTLNQDFPDFCDNIQKPTDLTPSSSLKLINDKLFFIINSAVDYTRNKNFLLIGAVEFNNQWLKKMAQDYPALPLTGLALVPSSKKKFNQVTLSQLPTTDFLLTTNDSQITLFHYFNKHHLTVTILTFILFFLGLTFIGVAFLKTALQTKSLLKERRKFIDWCFSKNNLSGDNDTVNELAKVQEVIQNAFNDYRDQMINLSTGNAEQESKITELNKMLETFKEKMSHLRMFERFSKELKSSVEHYLHFINDAVQNLNQINKSTLSTLMLNANKILAITDAWRSGIKEYTPRKFIRGLSETLVDQETSQLDQQVNFLISSSSDIHKSSLTIYNTLEKLNDELLKIAHALDHWQKLAEENQQNTLRAVNLTLITGQSQKLVATKHSEDEIAFINHLEQERLRIPLPAPAFISILQDLYEAILKNQTTFPVKILTRFKQTQQQNILLVTTASSHQPKDEFSNTSYLDYVEYINESFEEVGLKCNVLPALNGITTAIALLWNIPDTAAITNRPANSERGKSLIAAKSDSLS